MQFSDIKNIPETKEQKILDLKKNLVNINLNGFCNTQNSQKTVCEHEAVKAGIKISPHLPIYDMGK